MGEHTGDLPNYGDQSDEALAEAARQLHALMSSSLTQLLAVVGALGRRESGLEGLDLVRWLVVHLGVSRTTASQWVEAAAVLTELPRTMDLAATGVLSWDKLRQAARFAEPSDDAVLADELPRWSEAQLRQLANERCRRSDDDEGEHTERLGFRRDRHGRGKYLNGWLPNELAAAVEASLQRRADQMGKDPATGTWAPIAQRLARALAEQSGASLAEDADLDRATVVIHVDDDVFARIIGGYALTEGGDAISPEAARLAACDGRVQFVAELDGVPVGIGDAAHAVPRWLRRLVRRRDGRCRCCGGPIHHVHHIVFWSDGGLTDLDNLVGLCWGCHTRIHERDWTVHGDPNDTLVFRNPAGVAVTSVVQPLSRALSKRAATYAANALTRRGYAPATGEVHRPARPGSADAGCCRGGRAGSAHPHPGVRARPAVAVPPSGGGPSDTPAGQAHSHPLHV